MKTKNLRFNVFEKKKKSNFLDFITLLIIVIGALSASNSSALEKKPVLTSGGATLHCLIWPGLLRPTIHRPRWNKAMTFLRVFSNIIQKFKR